MTRIDLPFIDVHETLVAASAEPVWLAVVRYVERVFTRPAEAAYARVIGCSPAAASGPRPLAEGSTVPGFEVRTSRPPSELVLEGRHRFSTYRLAFGIEERDATHAHLRAETWATFPGVTGRVYRFVVIGSGGHRIATRRILSAIRHEAETQAA